ncbi:putative cysteine-rich receptor-like protein kinase 9 [Chenopodium quinoa]|uniref:Gnk2-homologous domain-containing protein n=1 Tax=Chenopodium quinoa TaxID=63459 RepID=A0A803MZL8_CHEQI|nr:putative cysteine-rich receptor-like protein kinase 9 [Chenopodium quinoa]XP_021762500.1 putative cysteine-rich receptor-like protein kinase 9 [Chenopodium quinoa]
MMIFPLIFIIFLRLECVLSTSNHSFVFAHASGIGTIDNCGKNNLQNLLATLTSQTLSTGFYNFSTTFPGTPNQLHVLYLCRGDVVDPQVCYSCINSAKNYNFENSFYVREGLIWYDLCMIRFSNESFLGKLDTGMSTASWDNHKIEGRHRIHFMKILRNTMEALAIQASNVVNGRKFASKVVKYTRFDSFHAMVQCTPDLLASDCYKCLTSARQKLLSLRGSLSGDVTYSSCMAQYKTTLAFSNKYSASEEVKPLPFLPSTAATNSAPISLTGTQLDDPADRSE